MTLLRQRHILAVAMCVIAIVSSGLALAAPPAPAAATPPSAPVSISSPVPTSAAARSTIGIEGQVIFRHPKSEPVQTVPANDKARVVVRIADSTPDGEFVLYDLRFIAQYAGEFDLRDCLRRHDGAPITNAGAIPVVIGKLLPEDHQGQLFEIAGIKIPRLGGYRIALITVAVLWLIPPVWFILRRLTRATPPPPPPVASPATLADQLRPLVEAAIRGGLSTPERARLELMLLAYWRERLGLNADGLDHAAAIRKLREHAEAGELLTLLERWLHRPPSTGEVVDVAAVLERYRDARPIEFAPAQPRGVSG